MKQKKPDIKRSMFLCVLAKPLGMIISLIYTPLLLAYLGDEKYGVWITMLSIINWLNYFDVGIGNGYRNLLAAQLTQKDYAKAKRTTATAYIALGIIISLIIIVFISSFPFMNINHIFNTKVKVSAAFFISVVFISINFCLSLCKTQLFALQKSEIVSYMSIAVNFINLLGIIFLCNTKTESILYIALIVGLSTLLVNIAVTVKIWTKHSYLIPIVSKFHGEELKSICNMGLKFFVIQIAALVLFTSDNIIITKILGPSYVTPYSAVFTGFGVVNSFFAAMMTPLWSRYTLAAVKKDYRWIHATIIKLDKLMIPVCVALVIGISVFKPVSKLWLHKSLDYDKGLILCMGIYYMISILSSIYATAMNGIGVLNMQLVLSVIAAVLNIPLSIFLAKNMGMRTTGVALATNICMLFTIVPIIYYMHSYLHKKICTQNGRQL